MTSPTGSAFTATFTPRSIRLAEFVIAQNAPAFGVRTAGRPSVHDIGVPGSPRWRLHTHWSPDDAWELETLPSGARIDETEPVPEELEWHYLEWADGTRAELGASVLRALPTGQYLLVRSSVVPTAQEWICFGGNDVRRSPPNALAALHRSPHGATLIGATAAAPPAMDQPMVGLAVLNHSGYRGAHLVDFFDGLGGGASGRTDGDLVLVVPTAGELVIDAVAAFSAEQSVRSVREWADRGARAFAEALINW